MHQLYYHQLVIKKKMLVSGGWGNEKSENKFKEIMEKEGFEFGSHTYTQEAIDEEMMEGVNELVAIFNMIKRNKLIKSKEDIKSIKNQLNDANVIDSPTFAYRIKDALINDKRGLSIFYEQLSKEQIIVPNDLKLIISNMPKEDVYGQDISLSTIVPDNTAEKEEYSDIIGELKTNIEKYNYDNRENSRERQNISSINANLILESVLFGIEKSMEKEEKNVTELTMKNEER